MKMSVFDNIVNGVYESDCKIDRNAPPDIKREQSEELQKDTYKLTQKFKADAFKELGIHSHPKAEKAFDIAWECGHSNGYSEVWSYLIDLVDLLQ